MIFLIRRIWHWYYYYFDALRVPHYDTDIRSVRLAWELAGISAKIRKSDDPWYYTVTRGRKHD